MAMSARTFRLISTPASEPANEVRITHSMLSSSRVDPCDPKLAKISLASASISICIGQRLEPSLIRTPKQAISGAGKPLGLLQDLSVPLPLCNTALYSRHADLLLGSVLL